MRELIIALTLAGLTLDLTWQVCIGLFGEVGDE